MQQISSNGPSWIKPVFKNRSIYEPFKYYILLSLSLPLDLPSGLFPKSAPHQNSLWHFSPAHSNYMREFKSVTLQTELKKFVIV
jgi:hypothetical protein